MRVVHVLPKFSPELWGGAESAVRELARGLPGAEVWTCRLDGDASYETMEGFVVRRFWSFYPGGRSQIGEGRAGIPPGLVRQLSKLGGGEAVVHVHCHNRLAALVLAVCRARGVPTVLTLHSRVLDLRPGWRYWIPNVLPVRAADVVVAVSEAVAVSARLTVGREDIQVIPNGVDTSWIGVGRRDQGRRAAGVPADLPILTFVGRISPIKNLHLLVAAVRVLSERGIQAALVIAGPEADPSYARYLKGLVEGYALLAQRVVFLPPLPHRSQELADLLAASDVVVVPSAYEAHPLAVLEAWAAGRPVVVANVGGMGPMVKEEGAGRVWDPATGVAGLADALGAAIVSDARNCQLARRARSIAARYSAENMLRRYQAVYEHACKLRDGRP